MSSAHTARCPARPFKLRNPVVPTRTDRPDLEVQGDLRTHQIAFARNADCSTQSSVRHQVVLGLIMITAMPVRVIAVSMRSQAVGRRPS